MTDEEKKLHIDNLWEIARKYSNHIMMKSKFKKLEEHTIKDNTFEFEEENQEEIKEEDEDY